MESYCLKFKKCTKNIDSKISGTSSGKTMILLYAIVKNPDLLKIKKQKDY